MLIFSRVSARRLRMENDVAEKSLKESLTHNIS
ncbi:conserved protein of unknown function [Pseudomonas marincola]|uniref:Uncharacterized protein n=1 Tax=Pseudomonas marincola TaxID=437900 RepID=A0A653E4R6_9PSED|nr:conserved protein of unknown function [Pseudomonas marincola]